MIDRQCKGGRPSWSHSALAGLGTQMLWLKHGMFEVATRGSDFFSDFFASARRDGHGSWSTGASSLTIAVPAIISWPLAVAVGCRNGRRPVRRRPRCCWPPPRPPPVHHHQHKHKSGHTMAYPP